MIPSVAIDNQFPINPDGNKWLPELYTTVFERMGSKGVMPFFLATAKDINAEGKGNNNDGSQQNAQPRIELNEEQIQKVEKKINAEIIAGLAATGATIGAFAGGPAGAAVGGVIGAALGTIAWFLN